MQESHPPGLSHLSLVLPFIHQPHSAAVFFSLMNTQKLLTSASYSSIYFFFDNVVTISYLNSEHLHFFSRFPSFMHFHLHPQLCCAYSQIRKALFPTFAGVFLNVFMLLYMNKLYLTILFYSFFWYILNANPFLNPTLSVKHIWKEQWLLPESESVPMCVEKRKDTER